MQFVSREENGNPKIKSPFTVRQRCAQQKKLALVPIPKVKWEMSLLLVCEITASVRAQNENSHDLPIKPDRLKSTAFMAEKQQRGRNKPGCTGQCQNVLCQPFRAKVGPEK